MSFEATFLFLIVVGGVWVFWIEPNWYLIRRKSFRIKKAIGKPLTILHLSDLHFTKDRFLLGRFFDRLARLDLDFVFVTGDLIDQETGIVPCVANLKKLKPKKGTYVVLGNHDYRQYPHFDPFIWVLTGRSFSRPRLEVEELKMGLRGAGFFLLENENRVVPLHEGKEAIVIGLDDPVTGRADLKKAFRGIENGVLHLALTHTPKVFPALTQHGVDVAFAGHTHGGQIRVPGYGPLPWVRWREPVVDSTHQFGFLGLISRGMGAHPFARLRLFCRPEACLIRIEGS